jgi:hypothetical protein
MKEFLLAAKPPFLLFALHFTLLSIDTAKTGV